ncbi:MAG TPA: hypothetical protein VMF65_16770, partial [Acidimicrobiales bacterium]|nr:hypothetical protein [Acidimicrobiales bacterium]
RRQFAPASGEPGVQLADSAGTRRPSRTGRPGVLVGQAGGPASGRAGRASRRAGQPAGVRASGRAAERA